MTTTATASPIDAFIARWQRSSGAERANFQMFASELCRLLGVTAPDPAHGEDAELNDYCFERGVQFKAPDGSASPGRIDLYRRGAFVMEAKQSREQGRPKELKLRLDGQPDLFVPTDYKPRGERNANRAWDQLMISARHQAQEYARALPTAHGWPPFVLVCDVGHCIEVYADFSGQGKNYAQFPDRQGFRIYLSDLRDEAVRARLKLIWENPTALDPSRQSAKVTREIAARLAQVSKGLEERGHNAEDVALFLMRCLFTMFAEDVELLPKDSFKELLADAARDPKQFAPMVEQLWTAMDKGDFAFAIRQTVKRFNGKLFKAAKALVLHKEEIGELAAAARYNWREVEPAIFGTLLEQALSVKERAKLGAHYTPRAYVERLVVVTVMEPLRQEWAQVQATADRLKHDADELSEKTEARHQAAKPNDRRELDAIRDARAEVRRIRDQSVDTIRAFHKRLCATRVLDPACGTGNFLYVSMELMKRLEGEVLEALVDLGGQEAFALDLHAVDPHQFLGLELNPRAAAIAELVIWLGYLQWHYRTRGGTPAEPILRDFRNITVMDAVLTWDGYPVPKVETKDGKRVETYPNARRPDWPEAEYIVGNPPFIGKGEPMRTALGDDYLRALWRAHPEMNESADFVMFWWDRAANILAERRVTIRFGFVTTNSITQAFNRRTIERHLTRTRPLTMVMAIPDHPWTKATSNAAAVRIAMTVVAIGTPVGVLREVISEDGLETDQPRIEFSYRYGTINSDLSIGADLTALDQLRSNSGLCTPGMQLSGQGFILTAQERSDLRAKYGANLDAIVRPYSNGRQLIQGTTNQFVIDCFPRSDEQVRIEFPHVYEVLLSRVKPERERNNRATYRNNWWTFAEPRRDMRPAFEALGRYIASVRTAKHRFFVFVPGNLVAESKLIAVGSDDGLLLAVLSSRVHVVFANRAGGWLGVGNDSTYNHSDCFDPFPFPECSDDLKTRTRAIAEELDAHRKRAQAEHPRLTLTQMYNILEKLKANEPLDADDERIKTEGLVLILKELHEKLDALVFEAYGWPVTLTDEEILTRLVELNRKRALEEKVGIVKWLRPHYQIPRFGSDAERARLAAEKAKAKQEELAFADDEDDEEAVAKPKFQTGNELAETADVMRVLATANEPLSIERISRTFAQGKAVEKRIALTILALARLGHLSSSDGGASFMLRRTG